ncbi:3-hydroxyacyl-ACP dehydratase FabZ family protein, partial [Motilibacter deserti]
MREYADIRAVLPHRHPVLLVDRVVELKEFASIVTLKAVSGSEPCYAQMDEGLPASAYAYPGSLLLESFGQSGALLWLESLRSRG